MYFLNHQISNFRFRRLYIPCGKAFTGNSKTNRERRNGRRKVAATRNSSFIWDCWWLYGRPGWFSEKSLWITSRKRWTSGIILCKWFDHQFH